MPTGAGGGGDNRPGNFSQEDVRQWRAEARQRLQEAQQLREELRRQGFDTSDLDGVIRDLRALGEERAYGTPRDLDRLQSSVVDGVKQFEYRLRRELLGQQPEQVLLSGSQEVPETYRKMVEEYYRSLSKKK
jgi:hypothetical protein